MFYMLAEAGILLRADDTLYLQAQFSMTAIM